MYHETYGISKTEQFLREVIRYTTIQDFLEQKLKTLMYAMYVYDRAVSDIVLCGSRQVSCVAGPESEEHNTF